MFISILVYYKYNDKDNICVVTESYHLIINVTCIIIQSLCNWQVIKQSLDPFWDQTLIFPPVELHGTRDHLKMFPPKIILEIFDKDFCVNFFIFILINNIENELLKIVLNGWFFCMIKFVNFMICKLKHLMKWSERKTQIRFNKLCTHFHCTNAVWGFIVGLFQGTEFCGRCIATPVVKLNSETYSPPNFPPTLQWYKFHSQRECSGEVLAAFELIEVTDVIWSYFSLFRVCYPHCFIVSTGLEFVILENIFHLNLFPIAIYCIINTNNINYNYYHCYTLKKIIWNK